MDWCKSPDQVEAQQLLKQTVPQLRVVHLVLQTKVCHQPHRLKRQRGLQLPCVPFVCCEQHFWQWSHLQEQISVSLGNYLRLMTVVLPQAFNQALFGTTDE